MNSIYLLLGSNLGEREAYLARARECIHLQVGEVDTASSLYETASWGKTGLPAYLNQVIRVNTVLHPLELLEKLLNIEWSIGRIRDEKWGSRIIDIDILFYNDCVIQEQQLIIPHPQLHLRKFTLMPFAEIAPLHIHPVFNTTIINILENLNDQLPVIRLN